MASMRDSTISGTGQVVVRARLVGGEHVVMVADPERRLAAPEPLVLGVGHRPELAQDHRSAASKSATEEGIGLGPGAAQHQAVDAPPGY